MDGAVPEPLVLLVEDDPLVLLVTQDALEAGGYTVLPVQLASEGLSELDDRIAELSGLSRIFGCLGAPMAGRSPGTRANCARTSPWSTLRPTVQGTGQQKA